MNGRWRLTAGVIGLAALLACTGCSATADEGADASTTVSRTPSSGTTAPALAGVPPCPPSDADVPVVQDGLPDLTLPCLTRGPDVRLAGLRGTPMVVNVWASWCPPCRDELGYLATLQSRTRGDLRVLGIDLLDRPEAARAAIEDFGVNYPSVDDADGQVRSALNVQAPPVTYFVDPDGRITFTKVGQIRSQAELNALVREHLGVTSR
jgi:thiol-disulfide isomerase/thioredoxin